MSEAALWNTFRERLNELGNACHYQRFEDSISEGIPDVNVCVGGNELWYEMKFLPEWPKRESTGVKIKFQPGQVPWLTLGERAGRECYVLLRVGKTEYLLFNTGFRMLGRGIMTRKELYELACWHDTKFNLDQVLGQRRQ